MSYHPAMSLTQEMLQALRGLAAAGTTWTVTMSVAHYAATRKLRALGLVAFIPRTTRQGAPRGHDVQLTDAGRATLKRYST